MEGLTTRIAGDRLHRLVVDNIAELVALVDNEGTVLYASPAHEQKLGYAPEDLVGGRLSSLVHPGDVDARRRVLRALPRARSRTARRVPPPSP